MTSHHGMSRFLLVLGLVCLPAWAAAEPIRYYSRAQFTASVGTVIVDIYSHPGYRVGDVGNTDDFDVHSDASMSAVFGETQYRSTGHPNNNIVMAQNENAKYCAGCNGSFLLTFTGTSIGNSNGVAAVGLDYANSQQLMLYSAFVTFGNGATQSYALRYATTGWARDTPAFFGIGSPDMIRSIHFSLGDGSQPTQAGSFWIDNLSLGSEAMAPVPEPTTLLLVATGLGVAARARRKRSDA